MTAGSRQTRKRDVAIGALLTEPTIEAAAKAAGIGEKTLRRWLHEPDFDAAHREAREEVVRTAVGRLRALLGEAIETLRRGMTCGTPSVEIRAAVAVIEQVIKGTDVLDLAERVAAVEERTTPSP
jgi:hypothetical protein